MGKFSCQLVDPFPKRIEREAHLPRIHRFPRARSTKDYSELGSWENSPLRQQFIKRFNFDEADVCSPGRIEPPRIILVKRSIQAPRETKFIQGSRSN